MTLRVAFAGTPEFAREALHCILQAGLTVPVVLTQPDRPAGRGMKLQASPVKLLALEHHIAVAQPRSLRLDGKFPDDAQHAQMDLQTAQPDVIVVAAYGLILPQWVLDLPRLGCLNIHASLLPRWRGAAPIHRAVEAGDSHTGITIMQMDAGLDTGDMLLTAGEPIAPDDTTGSLHDRLALLGGRLIVQALELAARGDLRPQPQPVEGVTYAHKIDKAEAPIDWALDATTLARRVRAFNPFPGASTLLAGQPLKVWQARAEPSADTAASSAHPRPAGSVLAGSGDAVRVRCGHGVLAITELQRPGGRRMQAAQFLNGAELPEGTILGN